MSATDNKVGRNDACPCGSGKKHKLCCGAPGLGKPGGPPAAALTPLGLEAIIRLTTQGRLVEAEQAVRRLLATQPEAGLAWKLFAHILDQQGKDPLEALKQAAQRLTRDVEVHRNLGLTLTARDEWASGLGSLERALALAPGNPDIMIDVADARRALGRPQDAVPLYQQVLERIPNSLEAQNNLGNALLELGQWSDAVTRFQEALRLDPSNAIICCNLSRSFGQAGDHRAAIDTARRAIQLAPRMAATHSTLAFALMLTGEREAAITSYRDAIRLEPNNIGLLHVLGDVLREVGQRDEALVCYRRATDIDPRRPDSHWRVGTVRFEQKKVEDAMASYRTALTLAPDYAPAHLSLGLALRQQRRADEAEASCQAALDLLPNYVEALSFMGELHADRGRFSEAEALFRRVIELNPNFASAYSSIATHRKMTIEDRSWLEGATRLLQSPLPLNSQISLEYALGKYHDDVHQYEEAFKHYRQANELTKRFGLTYDRAKLDARIDWIVQHFDRTYCRAGSPSGRASALPVLIIGMPRSGTSLAEQILASHPSVFGAGELQFWNKGYAAYRRALEQGDELPKARTLIGQDYLSEVGALAPGALRVIDKMPANFFYAGLIRAALPGVRIIHMTRHPIDTCLSIYFQNFFGMGAYANDLDDLAHYYCGYRRLMAHWKEALPDGTLLEVPYEALTEDTERWTRTMLDFIDLPWDPRCLAFEQTERVVITASKWQVRQKAHRNSVARWTRYEAFIDPLKPLLG